MPRFTKGCEICIHEIDFIPRVSIPHQNSEVREDMSQGSFGWRKDGIRNKFAKLSWDLKKNLEKFVAHVEQLMKTPLTVHFGSEPTKPPLHDTSD